MVLLLLFLSLDPTLRVCADPNNLPFSDAQENGFDNHIAKLIGRELDSKIEFVWAPARAKGFLREALGSQCDIVPGIPTGTPNVLSTQPYYRSSYVFVSKTPIATLDDPALAKLRIGASIVGDDYPTPVAILAHRGLMPNIRGFSLFGPPGEIVRAVENGEIDVAIAWGPTAGYFARSARVTPIPQQGPIPFAFDMSMGVAPGNADLKSRIDAVIERHKDEIRKILQSFRVPLM